MNRLMGFGDPNPPQAEAAEDRFTLIRCDECQDLTVEGVLPVLLNTVGYAGKRTTAEKWLCLKCLRKAGLPIKGRRKVSIGWAQRAYSWARERLTC